MPVATAESPATAALDPQGLARLQELDPDGRLGLVPRVLATYLQSLGRLQAQASQAWQQQDMAGVRYAAHTLKSSSASVGAAGLAQLCQQLERLAAAGTEAEAGPLVGRLAAEAERVRQAVQALLAAAGGGEPR